MRLNASLTGSTDFLTKAERQVPYATWLALNRTAKHIRDAIVDDMRRVFDRPTNYTLNALRVVPASRSNLAARVDFKDFASKGTVADRFVGPQVFGGPRSLKRMESALRRVGLASTSFTTPGAAAELDAHGNMSRGQIVRLLSYLQAFGEQGYKANATARSRARTEKVGKTEGGFKKINGVAYFVSRGKGTMSGNWRQPLPAGVYRKRATHGVDVAPVLVATKAAPTYTKRLPFYETADTIFGTSFGAQFDVALGEAFASAR